ncbi:MAG: hypothetical protein HYS21_09440 [Deltaproteobacteria bacterium]|nr:hypothetical protein [Deltaproteobacteria bacterium]
MRSKIFKRLAILSTAFVTGLFFYQGVNAQGNTWETDLKKVKAPGSHGTVLMDKNTRSSKTIEPVLFPHWAHRAKYTCKACHTDLGFAMKPNATGVTQADIESGKYCGSCHNGTTSFPVSNCKRCHSYGAQNAGNSNIDDSLKDLPKDHFGNKVDWVKAVREGKIKPAASPDGKGTLDALDMDVVIPVTKFTPHPPDVLFPHKAHTEQMNCETCHTSIFKQQKGGNPEMNMIKIISGQYCGTCHVKVAFPLDDCFRCHSQPAPKIEEPKDEKAADKTKAEVKTISK